MTEKKSPQFPNVLIKGRIFKINTIETEKSGNLYEHIVHLPTSAYDFPERVCIKSKKRLGNIKEDIEVLTRVHMRSYKNKNGKEAYDHNFWEVPEAA